MAEAREAFVGKAWDAYAYCEEGRRGSPYSIVGPRPYVALHGLSAPIVPVTVTEVRDDDPSASHWGWIDADADVPTWVLVWPSRAQYEVCFPYGVKAEEDHGKGQSIRLCVTERETGD
jgi:hypothetical protein